MFNIYLLSKCKNKVTATWLMFLLAQYCCAVWTTSAAEQNPENWKWNNPKNLNIEGLAHQTFECISMNRVVGFQIYLPPQYASQGNRRFPVVYFLHGAGGNESSDAGLSARVRSEILAKKIEPTIYVFPNGGERSGYRDAANSYVRAETMLIDELVPYIDKHYRTIPHPGSRALCGFSMGGGGSIRLALKYPDLFGTAASLAAALDRSEESSEGDNCYVHASALTEHQRPGMRLYFVIGDKDFLFPRHEPFLQHLKKLNIEYTYVVHSGVPHNLGILNQLSADSMIRHLDRQMKTLNTN